MSVVVLVDHDTASGAEILAVSQLEPVACITVFKHMHSTTVTTLNPFPIVPVLNVADLRDPQMYPPGTPEDAVFGILSQLNHPYNAKVVAESDKDLKSYDLDPPLFTAVACRSGKWRAGRATRPSWSPMPRSPERRSAGGRDIRIWRRSSAARCAGTSATRRGGAILRPSSCVFLRFNLADGFLRTQNDR